MLKAMRSHRFAWLFVVLSASLGAAQLICAWLLGLWWGDASGPMRFGYMDTYHWVVSYTIIFPLIFGLTVPSFFEFGRRAWRYGVWWQFAALTLFATVLSAPLVGLEVYESLFGVPDDGFLQWNKVGALSRSGVNVTIGHVALVIGSYVVLFTTYWFFIVAIFGAPLVFLGPGFRGKARRLSSDLRRILEFQALGVVGALLHLVCLRSAKLHLRGRMDGVAGRDFQVVEILSSTIGDFEYVTYRLWFSVSLGFLWLVVVGVAHVAAYTRIHSEATWLERLGGGLSLMHPYNRVMIGVALLGIIVPLPSPTHLILVPLFALGYALVRAGVGAQEGVGRRE